ncbi:MAG TPA: MoxR family ATPase [Candidatus Eremiobacteraeota bacterium]|nr:MAG: ATPase family associated with various cellular activities (AAA) [bacterium ADurb.Bin363]HPZ07546.1 MoxR family ATPase [Candidatus Eremiobacteraeota bacterium]
MNHNIEDRVLDFKESIQTLSEEINKLIVGNSEIVQGVILCLLARGHALLEGVPGLGKTLLVKTLSQSLDVSFSRIQFTPDLMPADIIGTNMVVEEPGGRRYFEFHKGPIFANIILADEINRATPKTQSALLEAMQEKTVTYTGIKHSLPEPFLVLATQNPIEMEGTYPLPEAQLDRFLFKLLVKYPTLDELLEIMRRTTGKEVDPPNKILESSDILNMRKLVRDVPISSKVENYVARLILATHPESPFACEKINKYVLYGSSPRGAQAIILASKIRALLENRYNVSFSDVKSVAHPALRHRIILNFEGQAEGIKTDTLIDEILLKVLESE